jgi:ribonuclease HI
MTEKCTKLVFALSRLVKLNWGLNHAALKTIYTGGILPLPLYGAPVWMKALDKVNYKLKLVRVQRLINIKMAKAYCTVSNKALCILTESTPIAIKIEEVAQLYLLTKRSRKEEAMMDLDTRVKHWLHPAETTSILTDNNENTSTIQIFTDRSKTEQVVGAGITIFRSGIHTESLKYRLNKRCTNNQAEQLAILNSLDYTEKVQTEDKTATTYTDSRMALDSLKNNNIHTFLIDEIRWKVTEMEQIIWKIHFWWVKAHNGIQGNKLADSLAKEAAMNEDITPCYSKVSKTVVKSDLEVISVEKWQSERDQTVKGKLMKDYFPRVAERLNMKINLT